MEKFKYIPHTQRETFALKKSANAIKCSTGSTQNNDRFVPGTNRDAQRFQSHYSHHFQAPSRSYSKLKEHFEILKLSNSEIQLISPKRCPLPFKQTTASLKAH